MCKGLAGLTLQERMSLWISTGYYISATHHRTCGHELDTMLFRLGKDTRPLPWGGPQGNSGSSWRRKTQATIFR